MDEFQVKTYIDKQISEIMEHYKPKQMRLTAIDLASRLVPTEADTLITDANKIYNYIMNGIDDGNKKATKQE